MRNIIMAVLFVALAGGCAPAQDGSDPSATPAANTIPEDRSPAAAPDRRIQPSPISPPAEVDPVRNEVGNETPG